MKVLAIITALFMSGCIAAASANQVIDNSPAEKSKREKIRKELCNQHHYPGVKFIRVGGKLEIYKVHIVISEQTAYECKF